MKINDMTSPKAEINIDDLSIEELNSLIRKCSERRNYLQTQERNKAYNAFVTAYRKFREVSPDEQLFRSVEVDNNNWDVEEVDIDVFDVLDNLFN